MRYVCKNLRGLEIHQAKIKCGTEKRQQNRTAVTDQTEEDQHYRTEDLQPNVSSQEDKSEANEGQRNNQDNLLADAKDKINWPQMTSKEWGKFDEDMERTNTDTYLETMTRIIYTIEEDRYGAEENS